MSITITKDIIKNAFKRSTGHRYLVDYEMCEQTVNKMGLAELYKDNVTIIDAYPGVGTWSAALNNVIKPKNHILMEPLVGAGKFWKNIISTSASPSLKLFPEDPYRWDSFNALADQGLYEPASHPPTSIHPHLLFTANLTHVQGEQLVAQYIGCLLNRSWIQRFGRVRLLLWIRYSTLVKLLATPGSKRRHRIGVMTEAASESRLIIGDKTADLELDPQPVEPIAEISSPANQMFPVASKTSSPIALIQMDPREHAVPFLDEFEYVVKTLFITKSKPLRECLQLLGPGAKDDLGPALKHLMHKRPVELSLAELYEITEQFAMWPFKPEMLHDFYVESESMLSSTNFQVGRN